MQLLRLRLEHRAESWTNERSISTPSLTGYGKRSESTERRLEAFGERKSLSEWARDPRCKVSYETLYNRVANGHPLEKIDGDSR